jgi:hypothetical protein
MVRTKIKKKRGSQQVSHIQKKVKFFQEPIKSLSIDKEDLSKSKQKDFVRENILNPVNPYNKG